MSKLRHPEIWLLIMVMCLSWVITYYNFELGIICFLISGCAVVYEIYVTKYKRAEVFNGINKIYNKFDQLNRLKMNQLPVGYVIVDKEGRIIWFNDAFFQVFYKNEGKTDIDIKGRNIENELNLSLEDCVQQESLEYKYQKIDYDVITQKIADSRGDLYIINFFDVTLLKRQKEIYSRYEPVFCYMIIDNYDESIESLPSVDKASVIGQIDLHLNDWANRKDAFIIHYENDRYLVIFEREKLDMMTEAHFHILDEIRDLQKELNLSVPLSLSIGVGVSDKARTIKEANEMSYSALEIAQARGGDQAVLKIDDELKYYGGSNDANEKHNQVKARFKAKALKEQILEADNVIIMGHQTPDLDSLGAGIGLVDAARDLGKKAWFVVSGFNYSINSAIDYLQEQEGYKDVLISPEEAEMYIRNNSLLIVVDTQKADYVDYPPLLNKVEKKIIIDHHRRPDNVIQPTVLDYSEAYASSACELVAELLSYLDSKTLLSPVAANALMAGICMDTKMFVNKTGVRTFEAAGYLKLHGASMKKAKELLQDDFTTYTSRMKAVQNALVYFDSIALSMYEDQSDYAKIIASQAADEMLNIKNIKASFVIVKSNEGISISARSNGDINVQVIMEALGGGGHFNMAGTQLGTTTSLTEAQDMLLEQLALYFEERDGQFESNIA